MRTRTLWNEEHTEHVHRTDCGVYAVNEKSIRWTRSPVVPKLEHSRFITYMKGRHERYKESSIEIKLWTQFDHTDHTKSLKSCTIYDSINVETLL